MRLLASELRRFGSRRACVLLLVLGAVLAVVLVGANIFDRRPVDGAEFQAAVQQAEAEAESKGFQRFYQDCLEHPRRFGPRMDCEDTLPRAEDFLDRQVLDPLPLIADLILPIAAALVFVALLAGTTFVGAEFSSGSMSNVLLFEPRRWRVWAAKLGATALVVGAAATVVVTICLGAVVLFGQAWTDATLSDTQWAYLAYRAARIVVLTTAAGVLGAAMTAALRSTIATVGIAVGYLVVGEAILRGVAANLTIPWLASNHVIAFLQGRYVLRIYSEDVRPDVFRFTLQESAIYLGVAMAVVLVGSYVVFRRRDIT